MVTKSFKDLIVWQKAFKLVIHIYKHTDTFPASEKFGLSQQMKRASVSVPSNIAEGYGRKHKAEYTQFLSIAYSSLLELQTQYLLSLELFGNKCESIEQLIDEVGGMLYRMVNPKY